MVSEPIGAVDAGDRLAPHKIQDERVIMIKQVGPAGVMATVPKHEQVSSPPSLLQHIVPIEIVWRPQPLEPHTRRVGELGVVLGVAVTGDIRVSGAGNEGIRVSGEAGDNRLQRFDRARTHAAACTDVERVGPAFLQNSETERVDWRFGDNKPVCTHAGRRVPEQGLSPAPQRTLVIRPAYFDVADYAGVAVREPGASVVSFTNGILASGVLDHSGSQRSLVGQVAPRRRTSP